MRVMHMENKIQKTRQQKKKKKKPRTNNEILTELRLTHEKIDISKLKVFFGGKPTFSNHRKSNKKPIKTGQKNSTRLNKAGMTRLRNVFLYLQSTSTKLSCLLKNLPDF